MLPFARITMSDVRGLQSAGLFFSLIAIFAPIVEKGNYARPRVHTAAAHHPLLLTSHARVAQPTMPLLHSRRSCAEEKR